MLVFQRAALLMPKLYKSITTSPRKAGSTKKRHDRNQRQPKKKVNTINNNIDDNNNNSKKQSNELNVNETIEERLTKLESKVKHMLIETCEMKKKVSKKQR